MSSAAKVAIVAGVGPGARLCTSQTTALLLTYVLIGTGAAVARAFSKIGYSIALLARREESLKPVQDEITAAGGQAISFPTDISDAESVKKTFQELSQKLPGPVEVAVFNASGSFVSS
jgi:NADP-dependent 3-hydroxy acid dehydrogenase YdfG